MPGSLPQDSSVSQVTDQEEGRGCGCPLSQHTGQGCEGHTRGRKQGPSGAKGSQVQTSLQPRWAGAGHPTHSAVRSSGRNWVNSTSKQPIHPRFSSAAPCVLCL